FLKFQNFAVELQYYDCMLRNVRCCTLGMLVGSFCEFHSFFGDGLIDSLTCCILMFIPEIGVYAGCLCVLLIGFDRLISITFLA
ncbi:hypothetical protein PENTCL1PPCAC_14691, partial [Pristionchus entomophagus]